MVSIIPGLGLERRPVLVSITFSGFGLEASGLDYNTATHPSSLGYACSRIYLMQCSIQLCQRLGWKGEGTRFDILPLVLQANGQDPDWFEIPNDLVLEVKIRHPE